MKHNNKSYLQQCSTRYRSDLIDNILPFWMEFGIDNEHGGVYTCLDRDGTLMDTTKSVWFQGRFAYIGAYAYNHIEQRAEWLAASQSCIDFIEAHCIDKDGHMFFTVTAEGAPVQKRRYVFSDCFAVIAMAEYAKATGDSHYANRALELFINIRRMISDPGFLAPKTYIDARGHSISMILINVALVLKQVVSNPVLDEQIATSLHDIEHYFMHPEFHTVLEMVAPDGSLIDTCAGRAINPGHCIETAWFIMEAARQSGDDHFIKVALQILDWGWEWGWDEQYGGIINCRDCRNFPSQDYAQDMKFWWPQCETIIATLYAYQLTGDEKYLDMHRKVNDWTYKHLPDDQHGEWYGYLHRDGSVAQPAKGNIFKGPFHIPRMLIKAYLLCEEILKQTK